MKTKTFTDPICGMQVERGNAPATTLFEGTTFFFCSDRCHDKFARDPAKHSHDTPAEAMDAADPAPDATRG